MPVFHTKTIESILDPVAQQVSRLVIIHEEGEAGHEMPDLERPVLAVSKAVANLAKVGREMVTTTEDGILRQDMPLAITKVENAASLLEDASNLSKSDPYSKIARTKLIEGSRWILQGTSSVLLCFDESEVRKIIRECKKVLDYLSVAEVIDSMEDLVQFVKDLSPCLSKVTREVEKRVEDLTHQVHRESLSKCVDQIKTLAPILICSMKIFIQILTQGGKGSEEVGPPSFIMHAPPLFNWTRKQITSLSVIINCYLSYWLPFAVGGCPSVASVSHYLYGPSRTTSSSVILYLSLRLRRTGTTWPPG